MAVLCWVFVPLALLLSAETRVAAVDQNQLAGIVNQVLNRFRPSYLGSNGRRRHPMFSVAVSIPYNSERSMFDISQVTDVSNQVRNSILNCEVYTSSRMAAATVLRWDNVLDQCPNELVQWDDVVKKCGGQPLTWAALGAKLNNAQTSDRCRGAVYAGRADHAEYRTLLKFDTLLTNHNSNDLLLFYILSSPCDKRCTSEGNDKRILDKILKILNWNNYAVVFSNVFKPRDGKDIPEDNLRGALERLGSHQNLLGQSIGLENIFRCAGASGQIQCTSCSTDGQVTRKCYLDEPQPGPSHAG